MGIRELCNLIRKDYSRLPKRGIPGTILFLILGIFYHPSFSVTFWFRVGSYFKSKRNPLLVFLLIPVKIVYYLICHWNGVELPIGTKVGGGLSIKHFPGLVVAYDSIIGENCTLNHDITIGRSFGGTRAGCPIIGNNVIIFPGARVIGRIKIGNNVIISANAVLTKDVPNNCVVAGVPAKIVKIDSNGLIDDKWRETFGL